MGFKEGFAEGIPRRVQGRISALERTTHWRPCRGRCGRRRSRWTNVARFSRTIRSWIPSQIPIDAGQDCTPCAASSFSPRRRKYHPQRYRATATNHNIVRFLCLRFWVNGAALDNLVEFWEQSLKEAKMIFRVYSGG